MAQSARLTRRIVGLLSAREADLQLDAVEDQRASHLVKWPLTVLLRLSIVCLCAGCKSLLEAEQLTVDMTPEMRHKLKLLRRIPDTTWRTVLIGQDPEQIRHLIHNQIRDVIHSQIRASARRKALQPDNLPFNVAMLDGKSTALPSCDDYYAQRQTQDGKFNARGLARSPVLLFLTGLAGSSSSGRQRASNHDRLVGHHRRPAVHRRDPHSRRHQ